MRPLNILRTLARAAADGYIFAAQAGGKAAAPLEPGKAEAEQFQMTLNKTLRGLLPAFALLALCFGPAAARADATQDAAAFIDEFGHRAIQDLTEPNLSDDALYARFRVLFEEGFDVPFIARSALGRFWPRATDEEKAAYLKVFEDYMVQVYAQKFRQYAGQTFAAAGGRPGPDEMVTVFSTVVQPDGPTTKIEWVVGSAGGKRQIRDIKIEGVSLIQSYRDQFANEILQRDGKVAGLIEALRQKTAHIGATGNG